MSNLKLPMRVRQLKLAVRGVVFLSVPESAVVDRINGHCAVIAPAAAGADLAASAIKHMGFSSQGVQWISRQASSVADLRMDGSVEALKPRARFPA